MERDESVKANWQRYALGPSSAGEITDLRQARAIVESALLPHEIGERRRMVSDGVIAEAVTGLTRDRLNMLKDCVEVTADGGVCELPFGVYPKHFGPDLLEFLRCHVPPPGKVIDFTYTHPEGVEHIRAPLCEAMQHVGVISEGGSGEVLGECLVDGESLEDSEPCDPAPSAEPQGPAEIGVEAAASAPAPVEVDEAPSDSRPNGAGGSEDAPNVE